MARKKKRVDAHVRLYAWLLKTPAWRSLNVGEVALLVLLYSLHNGNNNGQLFLSIREAAVRLHVSQRTVWKWFQTLKERGFIKEAQKGGFELKIRHATTWILTEHPVGNALPTKEFARWQPPADSEPKSRRGGFRYSRTKAGIAEKAAKEIQNTASIIDADGINHCGNSADLSPLKQGSRHQRLNPSEPKESAHGIKHRCTDSLPGRSVFRSHSLNAPESPSASQNPRAENLGPKLRREDIERPPPRVPPATRPRIGENGHE